MEVIYSRLLKSGDVSIRLTSQRATKIVIEILGCLGNRGEMSFAEFNVARLAIVFLVGIAFFEVLVLGESNGCLKSIANLPSVLFFVSATTAYREPDRHTCRSSLRLWLF